jgi:hypothetical protein
MRRSAATCGFAGAVLAAACGGSLSAADDAGATGSQSLMTRGNLGQAQVVPPATPGYASLTPYLQGCDWQPIYGPGTGRNYQYPEANAAYWEAILPLNNPAGTRLHITGQYADARFFSISLYSGTWKFIAGLPDYALQADAGSSSPLDPQTPSRRDAGAAGGGHYSADIVFGSPPAGGAEPNTLYVPAQPLHAIDPDTAYVERLYLLYRVYVPSGDAGGGVALPGLSIAGQPLSREFQTAACQDTVSELQQNLLYAVKNTPGQPAAVAPAKPAFAVYQDSGVPATDSGLNGSNRYMHAQATAPAGYLYLVRGKAPTHAGDGTVPQVRYWSVCQNAFPSTEVVACVGDYQALLDRAGYYHIVVSAADAAPPGADAAHGYNWMPFGPQSPAQVIYRQLLAAPDFAGAIGAATMGEYAPQLVYCGTERFAALVSAYPDDPEEVFAGCGG